MTAEVDNVYDCYLAEYKFDYCFFKLLCSSYEEKSRAEKDMDNDVEDQDAGGERDPGTGEKSATKLRAYTFCRALKKNFIVLHLLYLCTLVKTYIVQEKKLICVNVKNLLG